MSVGEVEVVGALGLVAADDGVDDWAERLGDEDVEPAEVPVSVTGFEVVPAADELVSEDVDVMRVEP